MKLKACTNFHYLAAEFNEEMREARKNQLNVTKVQKEKLILSDPMRKLLAIGHFIGSDMATDVNYRTEFKKIMMVSCLAGLTQK